MARPKKQGIDYFTVDVDLAQDDKFVAVAAEVGQKDAWYVITRLWAELYRVGMCYRWGEKELKAFAYKIDEKPAKVKQVVEHCLDSGMLSQSVYEATGFLTSKGIQKRFFHSIRGRQAADIPDGVLLIDTTTISNTIQLNINKRIVKNRIQKMKVSDEKMRVSDVETRKPKKILHKDFVKLSAEEYRKLVDKHGQPFVEECIEVLNNFLGTKKKDPYRSHYHAILKWVVEAVKRQNFDGGNSGESMQEEFKRLGIV